MARQRGTTCNVRQHGHQDGLRLGKAKAYCENHGDKHVHGWISALSREMTGLEGHATFGRAVSARAALKLPRFG